MLTKGFDLILREYRTHRMARFTAWTLAGVAVLWTSDRLTRADGGFHTFLWFVLWVCGIVAAVYYLARLISYLRARLLWRLLPTLGGGLYPHWRRSDFAHSHSCPFWPQGMINGQFATFLVILRLNDHFDEIEQVNRVVLHEARYGGETSPRALLEKIKSFT